METVSDQTRSASWTRTVAGMEVVNPSRPLGTTRRNVAYQEGGGGVDAEKGIKEVGSKLQERLAAGRVEHHGLAAYASVVERGAELVASGRLPGFPDFQGGKLLLVDHLPVT